MKYSEVLIVYESSSVSFGILPGLANQAGLNREG